MPLPDTPIISFTQLETPTTYFIISSELPSHPPSSSTAKVATSMAEGKYEVWNFFKKETINEVRKAVYKFCPDILCFSKK